MTKKGRPSRERPGYIYMIECRAPGEAFGKVYVGQTVNEDRRVSCHTSANPGRSNKALSGDVCLYGDDSFVIHRGVIPYYTADELDAAEFAEIKLQREIRGAERVYNIADGGGRHAVIAMRRAYMALRPEERSAAAHKAQETKGPEGRSAAMRKSNETRGPEGRSAAARKRVETLGPEGLREAARKGNETKGPEGRSAAARKRADNMGPERRSAAARKRFETIGLDGQRAAWAKADTPALRKRMSMAAIVRHALRTPEERSAASSKTLATLGAEGVKARGLAVSQTKQSLTVLGFRSKAEMTRYYCTSRAAELSNGLNKLKARAFDLELGLTA